MGDILGDSGANYTLTFAAINDDMVARQVSLNPEGNPFKEEWNAGHGWIGAATTSSRPAPARPTASCATGSPSPGLTGAFHYNVRLVSENFQVVSFGQSNPFLLV